MSEHRGHDDVAVETAAQPATEEDGEHRGRHERPEGAPLDPLIDLSRDPHPGRPDHARPDAG